MTVFIRLLSSPIPGKGNDLRQRITIINSGHPAKDVFYTTSTTFSAIPSSPFAYWVGEKVSSLFVSLPKFEGETKTIKIGLSTSDNFRFLRLWWETESNNRNWIALSKGGIYAKFYSDLHLLINWENDGKVLKEWVVNNPTDPNTTHWSRRIASSEYYFREGLTYSLRTTSALSVRALPSQCIFTHKGPSIFVQNDNHKELLALLTITNAKSFLRLIELQLGAATLAARSYEVGILQRTPVPLLSKDTTDVLAEIALNYYNLVRQPSQKDETTHVFCLPALQSIHSTGLAERLELINQDEVQRQNALALQQFRMDTCVAELYGVTELINDEEQTPEEILEGVDQTTDDEVDEEEVEPASILRPVSMLADLLMWCVGVAFGRWDVRYALDLSKLPPLPGPFDPLPICSPGMLTGADGLPLTSSPNGYPLPIAWDGFLVDDPGHPRDIISAVRGVFNLLWHDQAEAIEAEACQILGTPDLRSWFRDPRGFFAYHIKRYSKSRRKAPIYWLLQSAKRNYGIWLYYPRLNPDSLFRAGREYADAKLNLDAGHLNDMQNSLAAVVGSARKVQELKIATQAALVAELKSFQKALDAAALLEIKPDLNDGVLMNIAPLYELVPWKETERTWQELLRGKYEWSSISKRLRHKGLVKG